VLVLLPCFPCFSGCFAGAKIGMQNCKRSRDLNPPAESNLSYDILASIGGFKSHVIFFQFLHSDFGSSKQPEKHSTHTSICNDL